MKVFDKVLVGSICVLLSISCAVNAEIVAKYHFDEILSETKTLGNAVAGGWGDATASAGLANTGAPFMGESFWFFGTTAYVDTHNTLSATGDWTIAGWSRTRGDIGTYRNYFCSQFKLGVEGRMYFMAADTADGLGGKARFRIQGTNSVDLVSNASMIDTGYRFIAATREGDTFSLYIDGVLEDSATVSGVVLDTSWSLVIGNRSVNEPDFTHGYCDEISIYDTALSAANIVNIYNNEIVDGPAVDPYPANGELAVGFTGELLWEMPLPKNAANAYDTVTCDVYFGEDPEMVNVTQVVTGQWAESVIVAAEANKTYYWRVDVSDPNGTTDPSDDSFFTGDVWSFSTPTEYVWDPIPAVGATNVSIYPELSWEPGAGVVILNYQLYISEDEAAVINRSVTPISITDPSCLITASLGWDKTYYWVVDETTTGGPVAGEVWSFTTAKSEMIEPMGYGLSVNLQTVWTGSPELPLVCANDRMRMKYTNSQNVYERLLGDDSNGMDFSEAQQIRYTLQIETIPDSYSMDIMPEEFPVFTLQLLNDANELLYESDPLDYDVDILEAAVTTTTATMKHDLSAVNTGLDAVRKIRFVVEAYPYFQSESEIPADWRGVVVDDIMIAGVTCEGSPELDLDGDCIVNIGDLALFANQWLSCGLFPASACQ